MAAEAVWVEAIEPAAAFVAANRPWCGFLGGMFVLAEEQLQARTMLAEGPSAVPVLQLGTQCAKGREG